MRHMQRTIKLERSWSERLILLCLGWALIVPVLCAIGHEHAYGVLVVIAGGILIFGPVWIVKAMRLDEPGRRVACHAAATLILVIALIVIWIAWMSGFDDLMMRSHAAAG